MVKIDSTIIQQQTAILMMIAYVVIAILLISVTVILFIRGSHLPIGPAGLGLMLIGFAITRYKFSFENAGVVSMNVTYWQGGSAIIGIASALLCLISVGLYYKRPLK